MFLTRHTLAFHQTHRAPDRTNLPWRDPAFHTSCANASGSEGHVGKVLGLDPFPSAPHPEEIRGSNMNTRETGLQCPRVHLSFSFPLMSFWCEFRPVENGPSDSLASRLYCVLRTHRVGFVKALRADSAASEVSGKAPFDVRGSRARSALRAAENPSCHAQAVAAQALPCSPANMSDPTARGGRVFQSPWLLH